MAERRMIHANFFTDEFTGELNNQERILWIGLIVSCADDQGRLPNNPAVIRSKVFPYDDISLEDIARSLEKFVSLGRVLAYTVDIRQLIQIVNWWRYQNPSWAEPSVYPPPSGWTDRIRSHKRGSSTPYTINWDQAGGFTETVGSTTAQPGDVVDPSQPDDLELSSVNQNTTKLRKSLPSHLRSDLPSPLPKEIVKLKSQDSEKTSKVKLKHKQQPDPDSAAPPTSPPTYPVTPLEAEKHPDIDLFRRIAGKFPGQAQYRTIIDALCLLRQRNPGDDSALESYIRPFFTDWASRTNDSGQPYDPLNLPWLTEWAVNGQAPPRKPPKSTGIRARLAQELSNGK